MTIKSKPQPVAYTTLGGVRVPLYKVVTGSLTNKPRPTPRVDITTLLNRTEVTAHGCMIYQGARNHKGYGRERINGSYYFVHRLVHAAIYGDTPLMVLHRCGNPSCINPEHLYAGNARDNVIDFHRHRKQKPANPDKFIATKLIILRPKKKKKQS